MRSFDKRGFILILLKKVTIISLINDYIQQNIKIKMKSVGTEDRMHKLVT